MKKECIAMLLAGGQGSRLYVLTGDMAKPAVPFGGKYRIIDFPLSNCTNSGIDTVGVLTQYRPMELNSYIGSGQPWDLDSSNGGVHILPPYMGSKGGTWYKGTANAIYQNHPIKQCEYNAEHDNGHNAEKQDLLPDFQVGKAQPHTTHVNHLLRTAEGRGQNLTSAPSGILKSL